MGEREDVQPTTFRLPEELIAILDETVKLGRAISRTDACKMAIRELEKSNELYRKKKGVA